MMTDRSTQFSWPVEQLKPVLIGNWPWVLEDHGFPASKYRPGVHGPCPKHGGKDGFRLFDDFDSTGGAISNKDGSLPTGFHLLSWWKGCPWSEAVNVIGDHLHSLQMVSHPQRQGSGKASAKSKSDGWKFFVERHSLVPIVSAGPLGNTAAQMFANAKAPMRAEDVLNSETLIGNWATGQKIIAFPCFRSLSDTMPHCATAYLCNGQKFAAYKNIPEHKTHLLQAKGSGDAWFFGGGRKRFDAATHVLWCAGFPDVLSALGMLPSHWAPITNAGGEHPERKYWNGKSAPPIGVLKGKRVFVVGDTDESGVGQKSAQIRSEVATSAASESFLIRPLPDKDLRDWMATGNGWDEFETFLESAIPVVSPSAEHQPGEGAAANAPEDSPAASGSAASIPVRSFDDEDMTDLGNARHFAKRNREKLLYCHPWKKWLVWDSERWKPDDDQASIRLAKDTVRDMFNIALDFKKPERELAFAAKSASYPRIQAMLALAGPEMPVSPVDLDQNEYLLNCPNGTVDLRTGELKPHAREDLITKLCPTDFNPDAKCPTFDLFLSQVFASNPDLIPFLARYFGYCLTARVTEQVLPIFFGVGANGKSTLLNAFRDVFGGDYCMQGQPDFLVEKHGENHPTEQADLFGKRLVICSETASFKRLDEAKVKSLTGGERIRARRMREDFWEFEATHKLIFCTNHKPIIKGTDHGIWRRLLLIPFAERFEGGNLDKDLPNKLKAESVGILSWAVRGCHDWMQQGLNPPAVVTDATSQYRSAEDVIGRFIESNTLRDTSGSVVFKSLYQRFESWCEDTGDFCVSRKTFGSWLQDNGFTPGHSGGRIYEGLTLLPDF